MTKQLEFWKSEFGAAYLARNQLTDQALQRLNRDWGRILAHAVTPSPESVLEVGCNVGRNLVALQSFVGALHGIEPNAVACARAKESPLLRMADIRQGDGFRLPYADSSIDLVFTSGVLIHVAPEDLKAMTDEIVRVSARYVVAIEYFSHEPTSVPYRGHDGFLFKRDFGSHYLDNYPDLRVLDYGFLWQRLDSSDNSNWWLFAKR